MSRWDNEANETTLYFGNTVDNTVVNKVLEALQSGKDTIYVSFDVTGRTCHQILSYQLGAQLSALLGPKVDVRVSYNYGCTVTKTNDDSAKVPIQRITQKMDGDYLCACGCGKELNGTCYGVGREDDDEGYKWRMFTKDCWERILADFTNQHNHVRSNAAIYEHYKPSPFNN